MIKINKILTVAIALITVFAAVSCGKNSDDSKSKESSVAESTVNSEESEAEASNIGEYLKKAAEVYQSGSYTMKSTITSSSFEGEIKLTRVVSGDNVYQLQQETAGSYGVVSVGDEAYDFDNACGMYRKSKSVPVTTVIEEVVNQNLPMTDSDDADSDDGYVTEQYTFTGDTYITNVEFCFDKASGELKKYTMKYIIEGQDNIIETRVIDSISSDVDESVFNLDFINEMTDFESMTEEQRQGFCKGICSSKGITTDMMSKLDVTFEDFKTIDFDTFFDLVYTYGKSN